MSFATRERSRMGLVRANSAGMSAASGAPVGHGRRNEAIPFGAISVLDLERGTLEITITEPAVS